MRYAIYFTPGQDNPLSRMAAEWLGRDPFTGESIKPASGKLLSAAEMAFHTAAPRRYGFHATLKAPFSLAVGQNIASLDAAMSEFALAIDPVMIPKMVISQIDGYFALLPDTHLPELHRLADDVVTSFDRFRAPLTEAEIERRNPDALSAAEFRHLCQWGYPYVFDSFRFHMTLTGRVGPSESPRVRAALEEFFRDAVLEPVMVDSVALFVEPETGAPFSVHSRHALGQRRERKTA